jgi:hypothetical protein
LIFKSYFERFASLALVRIENWRNIQYPDGGLALSEEEDMVSVSLYSPLLFAISSFLKQNVPDVSHLIVIEIIRELVSTRDRGGIVLLVDNKRDYLQES